MSQNATGGIKEKKQNYVKTANNKRSDTQKQRHKRDNDKAFNNTQRTGKSRQNKVAKEKTVIHKKIKEKYNKIN